MTAADTQPGAGLAVSVVARGLARDQVERALTELCAALQLPTPSSIECVDGESRLRIGRYAIRPPLLRDSNTPEGESDWLHGVWRLAPELLTEQAARRLMQRWVGERALREDAARADALWLLRTGLAYGYKLSRLGPAVEELFRGKAAVREPRKRLEHALAADDICCVRVTVGPIVPLTDRYFLASRVRAQVAERLLEGKGLIVSDLQLQIDNSLPVDRCRIEWNDLHLPAVSHALALDPGWTGSEHSLGEFVTQLVNVLEASSGALVNLPLIELYLLRARATMPVEVALVEERYGPALFTSVCRELIAEGLSLRRMPQFLNALLAGPTFVDVDVTRYVTLCPIGVTVAREPAKRAVDPTPKLLRAMRAELRYPLSITYAAAGAALQVILLSPTLEARLSAAGELDQDTRDALVTQVAAAVSDYPRAAVVTHADVRDSLQQELRAEFPTLRVFSYEHFVESTELQPVARLELVP